MQTVVNILMKILGANTKVQQLSAYNDKEFYAVWRGDCVSSLSECDFVIGRSKKGKEEIEKQIYNTESHKNVPPHIEIP